MQLSWLGRGLVCLLLSGAAAAVFAGPPAVIVVSSEQGAAYQESAEAFLRELERSEDGQRWEVIQLTAADLPRHAGPRPRLYLALGTQTCTALAQLPAGAAVLCTLLPRASFERVLRESARKPGPEFSALYLNQPLGRQLDLARLALPRARTVGVLLGPSSQASDRELEAAAQTRGLKLVKARIQPPELVFDGLKKVIDDADVLLAVADPYIYNGNTIQNILLTSYRASIPMLAFSPAYVRAGALMAVYSTPAQIGRQAASLARDVLQGKPLSGPQYPTLFDVGINDHVARSMNLTLDAAQLAEKLRRLERAP